MALHRPTSPVDDQTEKVVWAFGDLADGSTLLAVGVTADGIDALALDRVIEFAIPPGVQNISKVTLFAGLDKDEIVKRLQETKIPFKDIPH